MVLLVKSLENNPKKAFFIKATFQILLLLILNSTIQPRGYGTFSSCLDQEDESRLVEGNFVCLMDRILEDLRLG